MAARKKVSFSVKLAEKITNFAGSMSFVYIHAIIFAVWTGTGFFGLDGFPFNFLTMIVSLESIFLSTFVMIGQNRLAEAQRIKDDRQYRAEHTELVENTRLNLEILKAVKLSHTLTKKIHALQTELHDHIKNTQ